MLYSAKDYFGIASFDIIFNVNDLYKVSNIFESMMFADDTNLFISLTERQKNLFHIVNLELCKKRAWINTNKLSLNKDKTKFTVFHKNRQKENIPLKIPS